MLREKTRVCIDIVKGKERRSPNGKSAGRVGSGLRILIAQDSGHNAAAAPPPEHARSHGVLGLSSGVSPDLHVQSGGRSLALLFHLRERARSRNVK